MSEPDWTDNSGMGRTQHGSYGPICLVLIIGEVIVVAAFLKWVGVF